MRSRTFLLSALVAPALALTMAASSDPPKSIPIPDDFAPEGIAVGGDSTFYTGSLWDGDIYRGDLLTGSGEVFIDVSGSQAVGLKVDDRHHLLFVAAGVTGRGLVYDTRDGSTEASLELAPANTSLINDVAVTKDAAYFTNTTAPEIYKVSIAADGAIGEPETITVTGPAAPVVNGFGLNGIDVSPDGDTLIVSHTGLGAIFTVDPESGVSRKVDVPGGPLPESLDGILLDKDDEDVVLWVVANFSNTVIRLELEDDYSSAEVDDLLTNDDVDGLFRVPTTVAEHRDDLVLVNGRFDVGLPPPFGPGAPEGTDYDVVVLDKF
jgi:sugar lactone lactonase YvrE